MKNIIKIGKFEFTILVIIENHPNPIAVLINRELRNRFNKVYSKGYISKVLKKLREAGLIKINKRVYELTKNGEFYVELYNKL